MTIEKYNNSLIIVNGDMTYCYPLNSIILIANDNCDSVNIRVKASRKNLLTFRYQDVTNIASTSAGDLCNKISNLINN